MAIQSLDIIRNWLNGTLCVQDDWDHIKDPLMTWSESLVNDVNQLRIDTHGPSYSCDNDGLPNLSGPLRVWNTGVSNLLWTFTNTITFSAAATFGPTSTAGFQGIVRLSDSNDSNWYNFVRTQNLAADRNVDLPLLTGNDTFVFENHPATLDNKAINVSGAGVGTANVRYVNSANDRVCWIPDVGADATFVMTTSTGAGGMVPVGTIIAHYDFNALATIVPDANYWRYCDGQVLAYAASPLNTLTLPDLSNRYLVGFGTEAGGDVDTAAWNVAAVGNTIGGNHAINIQHAHTINNHTHSTDIAHGHADTLTFTVDGHTHDIGHAHADSLSFTVDAHTHSTPAHSHRLGYSVGTATTVISDVVCSADSDNSDILVYTTWAEPGVGGFRRLENTTLSEGASTSGGASANTTTKGGGVTDLVGNSGGASSSSTTKAGAVTALGATVVASGNQSDSGMNNQLSATQDIQPRSIRVRWIMRVL